MTHNLAEDSTAACLSGGVIGCSLSDWGSSVSACALQKDGHSVEDAAAFSSMYAGYTAGTCGSSVYSDCLRVEKVRELHEIR